HDRHGLRLPITRRVCIERGSGNARGISADRLPPPHPRQHENHRARLAADHQRGRRGAALCRLDSLEAAARRVLLARRRDTAEHAHRTQGRVRLESRLHAVAYLPGGGAVFTIKALTSSELKMLGNTDQGLIATVGCRFGSIPRGLRREPTYSTLS